MKVEDFGQFKTGKLVDVPTASGAKKWAFVPNPAPAELGMDHSTWLLLTEAVGAISELKGMAATLPHTRLLVPTVTLNEAISSSQLEGTYTDREDLLFESLNPESENTDPDKQEILNCRRAIKKGMNWVAGRKQIDLSKIKALHAVLLSGTRGNDKNPGRFRAKQAWVGRYTPPPPNEMMACLADFEKYLLSDDKLMHPLIKSIIAHYQFESIHPFEDGNGRIGRVLLSLMIHSRMRIRNPLLFLSSFFLRDKQAYNSKLYNISCLGEWKEWIEYCLAGVIQEAGLACRKVKRLKRLRTEYRSKVKGQKRLPETIEQLFVSPVATIKEHQRHFGLAYDTAKGDLESLANLSILKEVEKRRPRAFVAPGIISLVFEN